MKNPNKLYINYLAIIFALILTTISSAQAATFTVNVDTDQKDVIPGDGKCVTRALTCTLRAALEESNALPGDDAIVFSDSFKAPNAPRIIVLTLGHLLINSNLTITGSGARQLMIDGNHKDRVFSVSSQFQNPYTVLISDLTIQHGTPAPKEYAQGGGIFVANSDLTLDNITIRDNATIARAYGQAGEGDGGGIFSFASVLTVIDSTITNNTAEISGGGIFLRDGSSFNIYNSTISDNLAKISGGGIFQRDDGTIRNSTITNNTAMRQGGGIFIDNAKSEGSHYVGNTIVANNFAPSDKDVSGEMVSLGNNLVKSRGSSNGYAASDLPDGTDPLVGSLQNNGGPTNTRALLSGSPAIDAGNDCIAFGNSCTNLLQSDQRGFGYPRKVGSAVDIGAFELKSRSTVRSVQIGGTVLKPNGSGLNKALVTITDESGVTRSVETDSSGRYSFDDVATGKSYIIKAESRHYEYASQKLFVDGSADDVNFVPSGR